MVKSRKLSAVNVSDSPPAVVGEERFRRILSALDQREKITDDKGREVPFTGETKDRFISACKTACPVIKKTYEGINEMGRVLPDVKTRAIRYGVPETRDPLVTDRTLLGLVEDWERLLLSSDEGRLSSLRKRTRTGRPAGDTAFVARVETITGRDLSKGKPGRPRKRPS